MLLEQVVRMMAPRRPAAVEMRVVWSGALDAQAAREDSAGVPLEQRATAIRLTGHSLVNFYGPDQLTHAQAHASLGGVASDGWR